MYYWKSAKTLDVPLVNEGGGGMSCGRLCFGHLVTLLRLVAFKLSALAPPPLNEEAVTAWTSTAEDVVGNFQFVSFILIFSFS